MPRQAWTDADIQSLTELRNARITVAEIAVTLGRTEYSVEQQITIQNRRNNKSPRYHQYTPEDDANIVARYKEGASLRDIAFEMGLPRWSVKSRYGRIREKAGFTRDMTITGEELMERFRAERISAMDRADRFHRPPATPEEAAAEISKWLRDEIRRCRKLAAYHGWTNGKVVRRKRKSQAKAA